MYGNGILIRVVKVAQVEKTYFPLISDVFGSSCVYVSLETTDVALSVSTADLSRFFL